MCLRNFLVYRGLSGVLLRTGFELRSLLIRVQVLAQVLSSLLKLESLYYFVWVQFHDSVQFRLILNWILFFISWKNTDLPFTTIHRLLSLILLCSSIKIEIFSSYFWSSWCFKMEKAELKESGGSNVEDISSFSDSAKESARCRWYSCMSLYSAFSISLFAPEVGEIYKLLIKLIV